MAKWWQVQWLKWNIASWNRWRKKFPRVKVDLSRAFLNSADLRGANLSRIDLSRAELIGTGLPQTNLGRSDRYGGTYFQGDYLSNAYISQLLPAAALWSMADLGEISLVGAFLSEANLSGANLLSANLMNAHLSKANLSGACLSRANLIEVDLREANLSGANLSGANLSGTDLSNARFRQTMLEDIDFRTTKGVANIDHRGPSPIHLPSIQLPQDGSALHFLRGVGLTDEWIDFWRTTMMHPIQYYSLFISYASPDETLARRLCVDLQDHGVRCWFAPEDLKIGNKFRQRIDEAIHLQDKLLLLLSEHSLASGWVENEVEAALEKEARQQREVLFPIRLDDTVMQTSRAWAATLRRTRHIGDFTSWTNPMKYQSAFDRLLRDLKEDAKV